MFDAFGLNTVDILTCVGDKNRGFMENEIPSPTLYFDLEYFVFGHLPKPLKISAKYDNFGSLKANAFIAFQNIPKKEKIQYP